MDTIQPPLDLNGFILLENSQNLTVTVAIALNLVLLISTQPSPHSLILNIGWVAFTRFWRMTLSDIGGDGGTIGPPASNLYRPVLWPIQKNVAQLIHFFVQIDTGAREFLPLSGCELSGFRGRVRFAECSVFAASPRILIEEPGIRRTEGGRSPFNNNIVPELPKPL